MFRYFKYGTKTPRYLIFSFVLISFISIAMRIGLKEPDAPKIDFIYHNSQTLKTTAICDVTMEINEVESLNDYLVLDTNTNYQQDFFDNKKLIQITNVKGKGDSTFTVDDVFTVEDEILYIVFSDTHEYNEPYCYEVLIEISNDITYTNIKALNTKKTVFEKDDVTYTLYENKDTFDRSLLKFHFDSTELNELSDEDFENITYITKVDIYDEGYRLKIDDIDIDNVFEDFTGIDYGYVYLLDGEYTDFKYNDNIYYKVDEYTR